MNKRYIALLLVLVLSLGMLTACGGGDDPKPEEPKENDETSEEAESSDDVKLADEQTFIYSDNSVVIGLNPMLNTSGPDNGAQGIFLETLIRETADEEGNLSFEPGMAEKWDISEDGLTYTFYIRDGAKWNDGVPVTANDFLYTFRKMATPATGSTNAWLFDGIIVNFAEALYNDGEDPAYDKQPEDIGVEAKDDSTLIFTLEKPFSSFIQLLNGAKPVREDKYEEWGDEYGSSVDKVVMNGPFTLTKWDQNTEMIFEKNEDYWNADNVKLERIERKIIEEPQTAIQALISGEIDVVGANDPDHRELIKAEGDRFREIITPGNGPEFFGMNCQNKYLKNPKIRQAFSIAFDRDKYIEELRHGISEPMYSLMPKVTNIGDELYHEVVGDRNQIIKQLEKDNPDPKALLIEGLEEEGLDPDPAKMEIKYATRGTSEYSKKSAEWLLQEYREKLGVEITIDMMEWNIMWDKVNEGDYDICTAGWGPYYNDPMALLELYDPVDGYFNSVKSGWEGEDADKYKELLDKASETVDDKERAEILLEAEQLLVGTGVIIPTYTGVSNTYLANNIGGYYTSSHSSTDFTKIFIMDK